MAPTTTTATTAATTTSHVTALRALAIGQVISFLIAGTGVFATLLSNMNCNFPTLMSLCNYILLSLFIVRSRFRRAPSSSSQVLSAEEEEDEEEEEDQQRRNVFLSDLSEPVTRTTTTTTTMVATSTGTATTVTRSHILWYVLAAFLDLEANFLVISAYKYTSVTSIMLLDCFTIPCVMALSSYFLHYSYTKKHIVGIAICVAGLGVVVSCDFIQNGQQYNSSNPFLGDMLCLIGSTLYACSNVLQETLVKEHQRELYLGYLGCFGSVFAFIQCMVLDLPSLERVNMSMAGALYVCGFVVCLFFMYTNTSLFLQDQDSTMFNLSLLTSDVYAVIFSYILYGKLVHWLYFIAFACVVCGLTLYHSEVSPTHAASLRTHELLVDKYDSTASPCHHNGNDENIDDDDDDDSNHNNNNNNNNNRGVNCDGNNERDVEDGPLL